MRTFVYISADRGIPVPGHKGSSHHVANVCRTLADLGLRGVVYTARPEADGLGGTPIRSIGDLDEEPLRPDFVYERYSLWHLGGLEWARRRGVPFFLEVNSPLPREARLFRALADEREARSIAQRLAREADGVICVSRSVARWIESLRGTAAGVRLVPNGVDERLFLPGVPIRRAPFGTTRGSVLGFCGSFRPWHGVDGLLSAVALCRTRPRVLCIGDGPGREAFERRAKELGIAPRVHVTGFVPHDEVPGWLAGCELSIAPYEPCDDFYFSPLKVFESMAMSIPVIAADLGQLRELLDAGGRGTLYPAGDAPALARAIDAVTENPLAAVEAAERARRWVLEHATWRARVKSIIGLVTSASAAHG